MKVIVAFEEEAKWVSGIANNDTEVTHAQAEAIIKRIGAEVGKPLEWQRRQPRHGIYISTVVGYLEEILNQNNGNAHESAP